MKHLARFLIWALIVAACGTGETSEGTGEPPPDTSTPESVAADSTPSSPNPATPASPETPATLPPPTTLRPKAPSTTPTIVPAEPGPIDTGLAPLIDLAIADLAARLGVPAGDITAVRGELVVWPDTSLGCPEPDMSYAQVPNDGSVIILNHAGELFRYHTGGDDFQPFLCEHPG